MNKNFLGKWNLTGHFSETGEMPIIEDEKAYRLSYYKWLQNADLSKISELDKASGLELQINDDKTFNEIKTKKPKIDWFDSEGVLDSDVNTFDGKLFVLGERAFLNLGKNKSSINLTNSPQIRYDDGDTKICDTIQIVDEKLLRIISVLTDELYTHRVILSYEKKA